MYEYLRIIEDKVKLTKYDNPNEMREAIRHENEMYYMFPLNVKFDGVIFLTGLQIVEWANGKCQCENYECGLCE